MAVGSPMSSRGEEGSTTKNSMVVRAAMVHCDRHSVRMAPVADLRVVSHAPPHWPFVEQMVIEIATSQIRSESTMHIAVW